eukprot:c2700_g1_i1.p1 GENE.c2700_g1_i1~~c2700_g1_i1.p1  ORF type:complete len:254 (-),score=64.00 c2700_g1_i1:242-1003(-)
MGVYHQQQSQTPSKMVRVGFGNHLHSPFFTSVLHQLKPLFCVDIKQLFPADVVIVSDPIPSRRQTLSLFLVVLPENSVQDDFTRACEATKALKELSGKIIVFLPTPQDDELSNSNYFLMFQLFFMDQGAQLLSYTSAEDLAKMIEALSTVLVKGNSLSATFNHTDTPAASSSSSVATDKKSPAYHISKVCGITPTKATALMNEFGSLQGVCAANIIELEAVEGFNDELARKVYTALRQHFKYSFGFSRQTATT